MQGPSAASSSLVRQSASEIARLIRQKHISPTEAVEAHLQRIEEINPTINAFAAVYTDYARTEAKRVEAALAQGSSGIEGKPLLGVPITIKSCIDVQGFRCESGSRLREGYVAAKDAPVVARLRKAGAIVIGNTTTPELMVAYHTENELHGRTSNPWSLSRTPGGSSGGEAAAVAACMSAAGIGSDGGGSIRVPAHFSGICGLKPTPGRIPTSGKYPQTIGPASLMSVVGPMARTVEDLQLLLEVTAGYEPSDPVSAPIPLGSTDPQQAKKLRIGFYEDDGYSPPTPEIRAAVRSAAAALRGAGFEVQQFCPEGLDRARELWFVLFVEAGAMSINPAVRGSDADISTTLKEFLVLAAEQPPLTGKRLLNTLVERDQLRLRLQAQMEQFPILLAPACSIPAFLHEEAGWGPRHAGDYLRTMTYCQHYNLLGNPAAVVPVARSVDSLPIGIQIIGRPYKEDEVLAVAAALEKRFGWKGPEI